MYALKAYALPELYWNAMLRGRMRESSFWAFYAAWRRGMLCPHIARCGSARS